LFLPSAGLCATAAAAAAAAAATGSGGVSISVSTIQSGPSGFFAPLLLKQWLRLDRLIYLSIPSFVGSKVK